MRPCLYFCLRLFQWWADGVALVFDAPGLLSQHTVFAATLAACENLAPTNPIEAYQPSYPLLMIHGTLDDKAPYEGGMAGIHAKRNTICPPLE